jgi:hypothetical protein
MSYSKIDRSAWRTFFESMTKAIAGRSVELTVTGLDVGDQQLGTNLDLYGISYDAPGDMLYLSMLSGPDRRVDHVVQSPQEVYVEVGETGLCGLFVQDRRGHKEFMRLREPLLLPGHAPGSA